MSDLATLYRETIIDHSQNPTRRHILKNPTNQGTGHNPLCGDEITVYAIIANDVVVDVSFEATSCAIATASASMMADAVTGLTVGETRELFDAVRALLTSDTESTPTKDLERLGELTSLEGVTQYPMRVKCATLGWHTLIESIDGCN